MPSASTHIDASPERVFALLAQPAQYPRWVIGCKAVHGAGAGWPTLGARVDEAVGFGPLSVPGSMEVLAVDAPRELVFLARAGPMASARVRMALVEEAGGTRVTMSEEPDNLLTRLTTLSPLADPLMRLRNARSLQRLKGLAERRR